MVTGAKSVKARVKERRGRAFKSFNSNYATVSAC
jgi:hypothetical protein